MAIQNATSASNPYSSLTHTSGTASSSTSTRSRQTTLGQEEFLKLMTTQMTHQDPSQPMQNGEFITQMAQFGTVAGIQDLQQSFADFANAINSSQALQATSLVGRQVSAPGTKGLLSAGGEISGNVNLTGSSPNVNIKITDPNTGELIQSIDLGPQSEGRVPFTWDGLNAQGVPVSPGVYNIEATGSVDGSNTAFETDINSMVDSVSMGSGANGLRVNLTGLDGINFNQIRQIL